MQQTMDSTKEKEMFFFIATKKKINAGIRADTR